jgi:hypothetical protein
MKYQFLPSPFAYEGFAELELCLEGVPTKRQSL